MTDKELLQQALYRIQYHYEGDPDDIEVEQAIKARLTQPEPKPVGCITEVHTKTAYGGTVGIEPQMYGRLPVGTLLYTAPSKKEWVGLTDEEYEAMAEHYVTNCYFDTLEYARAIEAKLKEKNT